MQELVTSQFWLGLGAIIWVNIILSGDNAVVIALAAPSLPARQQKQAIIWGSGAAIVLRILLTLFAAGTFGSPGMVMMSPQIMTTNSAPAARRTSRTLTT